MDIKLNSLVLYRNNPAKITGNSADKFEIELTDKSTKLVRNKDVQLLHLGPAGNLSSLKMNIQPKEDLLGICKLIDGSSINLTELAELIYAENSPQTAWSAWEQLNDGVYFKGTIEKIEPKSEQEINEVLAKRNAKVAYEKERENLVCRIKSSNILPEDAKFMHEIEQFALGKTPNCRLMEELGTEQTQEKAHEILLRTKHWNNFVNPHPERFGISLKRNSDANLETFLLPEENRRDLTNLETFAIDDEGCNDPDDALSFDGKYLFVHIADVASLITPGSNLDISAMHMASSLYLPEKTLPMLPDGITELFGLGFSEISPALTFKLALDADSKSRIIEIFPSLIKVKSMSYEEAEKHIDSGSLQGIFDMTQKFYDKRITDGAVEIKLPESKIKVEGEKIDIRALPQLRSRKLVEEAMLMTGEAVANFAIENSICIPFSTQSIKEDIAISEGLAGMFACRRKLKPALIQTNPERHSGLALNHYAKATSPLRRYLDLLIHQQLRAFINKQSLMYDDEVSRKITFIQSSIKDYRSIESNSNRHWTIVYMDSNAWKGEAVLVDKYDNKGTFIIPELAYELKLPVDRNMELNSIVMLSINGINLPYLNCSFQVTGKR